MQYLANQIKIYSGESVETEATPYDDATTTVTLNLAGNGSDTCTLYTPWYNERSSYSNINTVFNRTYYEVLGVSGTVEEY